MKSKLIHPRYYLGWIFVFLLKLFVLLPYKWQMNFGKLIGSLACIFAKRRYNITFQNLKTCFPNKDIVDIEKICKDSFSAIAMSGIETIIAWFMPSKKFKKIFLDKNFSNDFLNRRHDSGLILLGGHFSCMEIMGRLMVENIDDFDVSFVYQKHKSDFFEHIMTGSRSKYAKACFQRKNVFSIIKGLLRKEIIWYAPDQDFGNERSIFVPFYNVQCATLVATSWMADKGKSAVMPCYYIRKKDLSGYEIHIESSWGNFPSGDDYKDALRYNQFLEKVINEYPDQYLWQHRRFKTRPEGDKPIYG